MKRMPRKALTILSASTMAAGMAKGAIVYTYLNQSVVASGNQTVNFDLNQDGWPDFKIEFNNNNSLKPFISDAPGIAANSPTTSYVLSDASDNNGSNSQGLPLTTNGVSIDANYESIQPNGYFYQDGNANVVGGWNSQASGTNVQGYVGLELIDSQSQTHYGWAQFVYNSSAVKGGITGVLTIIDCAMETQPSTAILAGENAYPGIPSIYLPPASQTNNIGGTAQLSVVGIGNPSPAYQWMAGAPGSGVYTNLTDGNGISGSTNSTLTISNLTMANMADYVVVLTNEFGAVTSSIPARLSIAPVVVNGITPSPLVLYSGGSASLQVSYNSSVPITSFQWQKDGVSLNNGGRISGATSQNLTIGSLTSSDTGSYSVVLNNSYGSVTSAVDSVTITSPVTPYQKAIVELNPVSLYSLDETNDPASNNVIAFDYVNGHNGIYGSQAENGNTNYNIAGPRPSDGYAGFSSDNTAFQVGATANSSVSWVTIPPLNLNGNACTFTAWINPQASEPNYAVMISYRGLASGTANGFNLASDGSLGYHWNDQGSTYSFVSGIFPPSGTWSFIALAVSPSDAKLYLFNSSGMMVATNVVANSIQAIATSGMLGGDSVDPNYAGTMDEVGLFNYTLTQNQLTNLYNTAVTGVVPPPASVTLNIQPSAGSIVLTWSQGVLLQATTPLGPWTTNSAAVSPYTVTPTGGQMFYRVQVQ